MHKRHNPDGINPPFSAYSLGVEVAPNARWLYISGQVGVGPDGALAAGEDAQHEVAWQNVLAILASAGMGPEDIVRVNAYVTRPDGVAIFRQVRDRMLAGAAPASTLLVISGLAHPDWLVEIEATAARAG